MKNKTSPLLLLLLCGCSLAPDFTMPEIKLPETFKEARSPTALDIADAKGQWAEIMPMESASRGGWWKAFNDPALDALVLQATQNNPSLQALAARVEQSRSLAESVTPSFLPNLGVGANVVRAKPSSASSASFGGNSNSALKPYTLYSAQGVLSYEADLFGRVRENFSAASYSAEAQVAMYQSALLALQADVAQHYFSLRTLDEERTLLQTTVAIREEAARIMQKRFDAGEVAETDTARTEGESASAKADLLAIERMRAGYEHALAVLLGVMPSDFSFAEAPLAAAPPAIPAGLPSTLLARRPGISAATATMAAANARIGVARAAFFPIINLSASGGYESISLSDLFDWSGRTWALGQLGGLAITMPIFDSGRNLARLDAAGSAYDEAVANYKAQVLLAFRDVEDSLTFQRLLAEQATEQEKAALAASRATALASKRYDQGESDYFELVETQRVSLMVQRAAIQTRGQRFLTTVALIRALGGGWDAPAAAPPAPTQTETPAPLLQEDTGAHNNP